MPSPFPSPNTAIIPSTRPDYSPEQQAVWSKRHEDLVRLARRGRTQVAFFGDSLTEQWSTSGKAEWERLLVPLGADNFGIGGDRTQQVLWRMQNGELDVMQPRIAVLLIGTNNTDPGMGGETSLTPRNTPDEIVAGVTAIITHLRSRLPATRVLLQGLFPRGPKDGPVRAQIAHINAGLGRLDDGGQSVRFVDFGHIFLAADGSLPPRLTPDLLHLNEEGYRLWAAHLCPPILSMLRGQAAGS